MTLPYERRRALQWAGETLRDLQSPDNDLELWGGPVPPKLRQLANRILRHYPTAWQIDAAVKMHDLQISDWIAGEPEE
ncbi:BPSL0761 family protein [Variovorax sp. PAMC26660]|uniref:BPSL0761 family protein n=1 Tax=Variovorax sp. PAMC26660 TaxID=2762322 RepID=UPI00164D174B|nr:BPSL0761 family protein [Variovorax sp. PAMC26660]QNK65811.1 hypothetical protein H7F35_21675 [Variovorax sp. PAMC26660]